MYGVSHSMFSIERARSSMIFDARNSSRRWTMTTFEANFDRKIASSIALSPPPTIIVGFSLKNAASQVAQYDTPRPLSSSSPRTSSFLCSAPIARMTVRARYSSLPTQTLWTPPGSSESSTFVASSVMKRVPKRSAWSRNFCMSSGPSMPSGKPG